MPPSLYVVTLFIALTERRADKTFLPCRVVADVWLAALAQAGADNLRTWRNDAAADDVNGCGQCQAQPPPPLVGHFFALRNGAKRTRRNALKFPQERDFAEWQVLSTVKVVQSLSHPVTRCDKHTGSQLSHALPPSPRTSDKSTVYPVSPILPPSAAAGNPLPARSPRGPRCAGIWRIVR